jgi:hypothetical protein
MTPVSRPLRALGVTLGGWTMMRVVALWPVSGVAVEARPVDAARAAPASPVVAMPLDDDVPLFAQRPLSNRGMKALGHTQQMALVREMATLSAAPTMPDLPQEAESAQAVDAPVEARTAVAPGLPPANPHNRFSGSAWALMRGDGAPSLASGGQLGGSQIGMRLFYTPGPEAFAITARVSAPLSQPSGREAAIGIALRGRNAGLIAEQRFALNKGGRDAPAVFAYGGVSDVNLPGGLKLDGYAQAGLVGIKNPAAFVDGAIRVERTVLTADKASLAVGAGAWGGAQPGASRFDVGPQVVAHITLDKTNLRVSAEWRQRIAGDAAPASGPSVTVGFDF